MTTDLIQRLDALDPRAVASLFGRSILTTAAASDLELQGLLRLAEAFAALDHSGVRTPLFPQELAYAVFFDNSTRTKSAWAGAAARLGMTPVIVDGGSTQVAHGETAQETGAMLGMNAHALGIRHDLILGEGNAFMQEVKRGIDGFLDATGDKRHVPIVNLQCDVDHPTQSLADLLTLRQRFPGGLAGKKITVSWAYSPSYAKPLSVPQGLISLVTRFGAHVTLAHPKGYQLLDAPVEQAFRFADASGGSFRVVHDMDQAFDGAHVVYPKSWGPYDLMMDRVQANRAGDRAAMSDIERQALERNALHTDWICDEARMARTEGGKATYMHCLPADIGAEVSAGVLERFRHDLARQASWKVYVIMAMLAGAKISTLPARLRTLVA